MTRRGQEGEMHVPRAREVISWPDTSLALSLSHRSQRWPPRLEEQVSHPLVYIRTSHDRQEAGAQQSHMRHDMLKHEEKQWLLEEKHGNNDADRTPTS